MVLVIGVRWRCEPRDHGQEEGGCPRRLCCCLAFFWRWVVNEVEMMRRER